MQRAVLIFSGKAVGDASHITLLLGGEAAHFPALGHGDGDVINLFGREVKINRMDAIGVFEDVLLFTAEESDGEEGSPTCSRSPTRDRYVIFGDQRLR